jgi:methyltransferase-like protein 6
MSFRFFKDRHYLEKEWEELRPGSAAKKILEVGCGVGNTTLPLLRLNPELQIWCCDFSDNAIEILGKNTDFDSDRCTAFVSDITRDSLSDKVGSGAMDLCLMIFVLSAIAPAKMLGSLQNIAASLRPGGLVLFRDYALYDMAQLKMAEPRKHKISDNFYVRGDGTSAYYFEEKELISLFNDSGFDVVSCELHRRAVVNRKEGTTMHRRWLQARFVKR